MFEPHLAPTVEIPLIVVAGSSMKAVDAVNVATVTTTGGEDVGSQSSLRSTGTGNASVAATSAATKVITSW